MNPLQFERHPQANEVVEAVRVYANRGWSPAQIIKALLETYAEEPPAEVRRCRGCGCTDERACPGGCWWVELDLCSTCADGQSVDARQSIAILRGLLSLKHERGGTPLGLS